MEYLNSLVSDNEYNDHQLLLETPIGWSSMCFDQTINYYLECNSNANSFKEEKSCNQ